MAGNAEEDTLVCEDVTPGSPSSAASMVTDPARAEESSSAVGQDSAPIRSRIETQRHDLATVQAFTRCLLQGQTPSEIKRNTGLGRSTIYQWQRNLLQYGSVFAPHAPLGRWKKFDEKDILAMEARLLIEGWMPLNVAVKWVEEERGVKASRASISRLYKSKGWSETWVKRRKERLGERGVLELVAKVEQPTPAEQRISHSYAAKQQRKRKAKLAAQNSETNEQVVSLPSENTVSAGDLAETRNEVEALVAPDLQLLLPNHMCPRASGRLARSIQQTPEDNILMVEEILQNEVGANTVLS